MRAYGGISRICKGARLSIAEARDVELIAAKVLVLGCSLGSLSVRTNNITDPLT